MPRTTKALSPSVEPKTRRTAPSTERKRTPVRRKALVPEFDEAAHRDEIAEAAYLIWLQRGGAPGSQVEDWCMAATTVREKYTAHAT
jgi:hypothetical protein